MPDGKHADRDARAPTKDDFAVIEINSMEKEIKETSDRQTDTAKAAEIRESEAAEVNSKTSFWRDKRAMISVAVIAFLLIGAVIFWAWQRNRSDAGQVMPAPRNVSFGQDEGGTSNSALPEEETLTIPLEQVEQIRLETQIVGETFSEEITGATATGVVQANAYQETPVISLVGGVVRQVGAQLGEFVQRGETVAVIYSDALAQAQSNYLSTAAEADEARKRYERALRLSDVSQEARTEIDQATAAVRIAEAEHLEHLSHYNRTEKLVKIGAASREEFEIARSRHETAKAKLDEAKKRLERANRLLRINPERQNEIDRALTQLRSTEAGTAAEREKLLVLGLSPQRVDQLRSTRRVSSELPVQSPVSGTVTARMVNQNEIVEANKELFRVTNLSSVWVIAEVFEQDLARIRVGSGASVSTDAYPGRIFRGQVTYIDPNINQETRTAQARVELENPGQILKIGMYVKVAFGALGMAEQTAPVVPASAVQTLNNRQVVFLTTDQPNVFLLRYVRLGAENSNGYVVLEGINVGDKVVTTGSFLLRAERSKQKTNF